ncbi:MAG TPA: hypothetical protein VGC88_06915 [Terriglobales bacterium]|jgi:hypothetical protein
MFSNDEEVQQLRRGFEQCTLTAFHHAHHLAVAVTYCRSSDQPLACFREHLQNFAAFHGKHTLYHETLTWFWIREVQRVLATLATKTPTFQQANIIVRELGDKDLPLRYWSRDVLFSPDARTRVVEPDLAPLP